MPIRAVLIFLNFLQGPKNSPSTQTKLEFAEVGKQNRSPVWSYFIREIKGHRAKCKDESCGQILHHRGSKSPLITHMPTRHGISVQLKTSNLIQGILEFSINEFKNETANLDIIFK